MIRVGSTLGRRLGQGRMASSTLAFSDSSFDSSSYSNYRPTYGPALFDQLYAYHRGGKDVAVDIGCGTGQITSILASTFRRVYGLDTSAKMLTQATKRDNITYEVSSAESIPSLPDGSVDLITVGQAAHWFDHAAWFREMARIMKPDATLSFWSYNEAEFSESEEASKIWNRYSHAQDKLGPYWPQPGRSILESAMDGVDPPESLFVDIERHYTAQRQSKETQSPVRKEMMLSAAESYFRTSSAYHGWRVAHPDAISRRENGAGDVIDEMMDEICHATGWTSQTVVKVHWPTVAVLARKA